MARHRTDKKRYLPGFSLVEVLIALVIMSVGMLGIAGLYVQSMQAGRTSMFRHHAVTLAGDVADRIRANPIAGNAYHSAAGDEGVDNGCVSPTANCSTAELAANDIAIWHDQAETTLPNGEVAVQYTAATGGNPPFYEITVSWNEPNPLGGEQPEYSFTIPVLPI